MSTGDWTRIKQIFQEALDLSPAEREAFLDRACEGDDHLRAEVETLLTAHEGGGDRLLPTTVWMPDSRLPLEGPGTTIGRYRLLQQIGEGGFGSVYMAEQEQPVRRKVALKIIKLGMDTKQIIARFEAERQALALMDHPNIARVLDAGATETGRPYFVMELVRGIPITDYCDQNNLTTGERLTLFQAVCGAVQHAHQKGIIHRDIKPSNVMVTLHDGVPVPKVIDFGIAKATNQKLTEKTLFTEFHQFVGTPQYMSPEQAEMSGLDVDTRTDIYALGVLLYELLTGTTPFDAQRLRGLAYSEIHRVIREEEPDKPSTRVSTLGHDATAKAKSRKTDVGTLRKDLSGDLDWIVMRAIEKDRTRRYDTANSLRLDIERHLKNEPILASPPSASYRIRKFVRRNRTAVLVFGVVAAALLTGVGVATYGFLQASRERAIARQEAEAATAINDFFTDMLASLNPRPFASRLASPTLGVEADAAPRKDVSVKEMLRQATDRIGASFEGKPLLEAEARETIGKTLFGLKANSEALEQFNQALELRRGVLGEGNREVLRSRLLTIGALGDVGQAQTAAKLAGETLSDLERYLGKDDPLTLVGASLYASTLVQSGNFSSVDSIYTETLERQRRVLGPEHRDTIATLFNLAMRHCWDGNGPEAVKFASEAAEHANEAYGPDDPQTIAAEAIHAFSLNFMYRTAEAKAIARPTLERAKRVFGPDEFAVGMLEFALARALNTDDESEEKEDLYRRFREDARRKRGPGQNWVRSHDYTVLLVRMGKIDEAVEVAREAYNYWNNVGDEAENRLTRSRTSFVRNLTTRRYRSLLGVAGRWNEIRTLEGEQLSHLRDEANGDSAGAPEWNRYAWELLTCEPQDLRDPADALEWATRAVEADDRGDAGRRANLLDTQARALAMTGDLEGALRTQSRALDLCESAGAKAADQGTATLLPELVRYSTMLGRDAEAKGRIHRVVETVVARDGPSSEGAANALRNIGDVLASRGFDGLAEPLLRRSVAEARQLGDKKILLENLIALARSRARDGHPEESEPLVDEAMAVYRRTYVSEPVDWSPGLGLTVEGERSDKSVHFKAVLAFRLLELGRTDEAQELLHQVECARGGYTYESLKGKVLLTKGDAEHALPYIRTRYFKDRMSDQMDRRPGDFVSDEGEYGHCLSLAGQHEEAEAVLLRAYDLSLEWCGPESAVATQLERWITDLYEAWGKHAEAVKWRNRGEDQSWLSDRPASHEP
jgi:serine/threonine protein kinase/tetratricopeptide (TPR) repeat protein